jgi:hypothetical protein
VKVAIFSEQFSDEDDMNRQEEIRRKVENYEPQYAFVAFKMSAAMNSNGDLEEYIHWQSETVICHPCIDNSFK